MVFSYSVAFALVAESSYYMTSQSSNLKNVKELAAQFGVSRQTIWNWCNPKKRNHIAAFPKPIKISPHRTAWLESEINAYVQQLAENRHTAV